MSRSLEHSVEQPPLFEIQAVPKPLEYIRQMWRHRQFMSALPMEQLHAQHQTTFLGNIWHLMNPLLSVVVYYAIFGVILETNRGTDNFILFLMVGIFSFNLTTKCFVDGARSISINQGLMRSLRFPRALLPFSAVLSSFLTFGFELAILAVVALATGEGISLRWLALPVVVFVHWVFNLGGAFITARLNDSFSDVQQLIPFVMRLAMYASGVIFPIRAYMENRPRWAQLMVEWNPFVELVDMYRWVFLGSEIDRAALMRFLVLTTILIVVGFRYFIANESRYGRG